MLFFFELSTNFSPQFFFFPYSINNETPETTSETIDPSSSVASDEYSAEGSSSATSAGQKGVAGMGSHTSLASTGIESQEPQEGGYGTRGVEHENRNKDGSEIIGQEANSESIKEDLGEVENARERVHKYWGSWKIEVGSS